ncbi:MAG: phospholipid/cholesterol/gamma-HCH transport system substrate-binding protein [Cryptosporangiaceae bacterium]|nr:phospholipid/cholesterol/gamma-HCH transport system substrate-binding protein [Cryptosporangiaceae bacterium]
MTRRPRVLALVAIAGIALAGLRYTGIAGPVAGPLVVHAEFAAAAGLAERADVSYRGVPAGRVGAIRLTATGVRVDLLLDPPARIPAGTQAVIATRSAAGDSYVDLRPRTAGGPFLAGGATIPRSRTSTPVAAETALAGASRLLGSLDPHDLATVIDELGQAFDGTGPALASLADDSAGLTATAEATLPHTIALLRDSRTALAGQAAQSGSIATWSRALASLSAQLDASQPDLRRLLVTGTDASRGSLALLNRVQPDLGVLLSNLIVTGQVQARRVGSIRQVLAAYPAVVAQGSQIVPGDGTAHLGLVLTQSTGNGARGTSAVPRPGGGEPGPVPLGPRTPAAPETAPFAGFDPATGIALGPDGRALTLGGTGGQRQLLGEQSWKSLLIGPLAS